MSMSGRYMFSDDEIRDILQIEPVTIKYRDHGTYLLAFAPDKVDQIEAVKAIPGVKFISVIDTPPNYPGPTEILINLDDFEGVVCTLCRHIMPAGGIEPL